MIRWDATITCDSFRRCDATAKTVCALTHEREIETAMPKGWAIRAMSLDDSQRDVARVDPMGGQISTYCPEHASER